MPVPKELLDILVCPADHGELDLIKNATALKCRACRRIYRIEDDIPIMLVDEATYEKGEGPKEG
jgi:hypothetical protein